MRWDSVIVIYTRLTLGGFKTKLSLFISVIFRYEDVQYTHYFLGLRSNVHNTNVWKFFFCSFAMKYKRL